MGLTNVCLKKILCLKNFGFENYFWSNKIVDPKIVGLKICGFEKNLSLKKFGPKTFWSTKIIIPKKLGPKSSVKIGPVTAEILLILANVARAYMLPGQKSPP